MKSSSQGGVISFLGLLAIVLIVLKLAGIIAWSWVWVLAPIWIPWVFIGVVLLIFLLAYLTLGAKVKVTRRK